jgi:hypothetical protein
MCSDHWSVAVMPGTKAEGSRLRDRGVDKSQPVLIIVLFMLNKLRIKITEKFTTDMDIFTES